MSYKAISTAYAIVFALLDGMRPATIFEFPGKLQFGTKNSKEGESIYHFLNLCVSSSGRGHANVEILDHYIRTDIMINLHTSSCLNFLE